MSTVNPCLDCEGKGWIYQWDEMPGDAVTIDCPHGCPRLTIESLYETVTAQNEELTELRALVEVMLPLVALASAGESQLSNQWRVDRLRSEAKRLLEEK